MNKILMSFDKNTLPVGSFDPVDRKEKFHNFALGLLHIGFGKTVKVEHGHELQFTKRHYSCIARISAIVLFVLIFPITIPLALAGVYNSGRSRTFNTTFQQYEQRNQLQSQHMPSLNSEPKRGGAEPVSSMSTTASATASATTILLNPTFEPLMLHERFMQGGSSPASGTAASATSSTSTTASATTILPNPTLGPLMLHERFMQGVSSPASGTAASATSSPRPKPQLGPLRLPSTDATPTSGSSDRVATFTPPPITQKTVYEHELVTTFRHLAVNGNDMTSEERGQTISQITQLAQELRHQPQASTRGHEIPSPRPLTPIMP